MKYFFLALFPFLLFSCKKKEENVITDYTYAGKSTASMENVITLASGTNTVAWDSNYLDKIYVHYDIPGNTISFTVSEQYHACQTFQTKFTFTRNHLNVYTANSPVTTASHTFELGQNTLTAHMLRHEGSDSVHNAYRLDFQGVLVQ